VRELIDALDARYPGVKARLMQGDQLRSGMAVVIDTQMARGGLADAVAETSEVHFIPAIAGG
jgi:sulfur-carrier protein